MDATATDGQVPDAQPVQSTAVPSAAPAVQADGTPEPSSRASAPAEPQQPAAAASKPATSKKARADKPISAREALEAVIATEPRNPEAWHSLLDLALRTHDMADIRATYDRFFEIYPNAAAQWIAYAELELGQSNFAQVDAIFVRSLRTTLSIDLWKFYLAYTRRVNPLPPFTGEENSPRDQTQRVLEGAYEFALKYVGWHHESGDIWQDYIALVRSRETSGSWQEGQKMDQLRRIFQRAVAVPIDNVEAIWREYDAYESGLNKVTAKKFLGEKSPAYMQARTVLRELKSKTNALERPPLPTLPTWVAPHLSTRSSVTDRSQYDAWHEYLRWEESNPLMIEDAAALQSRILSAYRHAVMHIRFDPVVWFMASKYCASVRRPEAGQWLRSGIAACPWSFLLHFAFAEQAQAEGQYAEGTAVLDALVEYVGRQIDSRLAALAQRHAQVDTEIAAAKAKAIQRLQQLDSAPDDDDEPAGALADVDRSMNAQRAERKEQLDKEAAPELDEWRAAAAQLWIKYMHFVRRAEGIRATRQVFSRARRSPHCTWPVYEANALLEYHCSKDAVVATKVFELALKMFGSVPQLVVRYLDFLISVNDDTNARALFERTISGMPADHARLVWERWAAYEYCYGDASAISRLESRLGDLYPDELPVERAANRSRYDTLDFVRTMDMGLHVRASDAQDGASGGGAAGGASGGAAGGAAGGVGSSSAAAGAASSAASGAASAQSGPRTMEDIRRALVAGGESEKRGTTPLREPASKKAKTESSGRAETPTGIPDALTYFVSLLPAAALFDGPVFSPDAIVECLQHTALPPMRVYTSAVVFPCTFAQVAQGNIYTERVMALLNIDGSAYVYERVVIDPKRILSFSEYLPVREHIEYRPYDKDDHAVVFEQRAEIECKGIHGQTEESFLSNIAHPPVWRLARLDTPFD
ncbi:mRNA 3'-end-processing protein rna14 [Malassezia cuniculi]|uniref:mRNA 3'-end-processing protein RNA14 n=1 Tax=Malassezia cuniculi TaxID=948313 RepID=A0AAF0J4V3_9BASI|nr:mRNA 3'-end-processing protein rna14 [Malassezia cuniculi]